ncbi:unnamed protein product [Schistosoma margrebowiei]|uniref:Uncharacterized protein n=1 Tax=Schistosoma margrebowiei TaxID=48269 RepID=A0A3P8B3I6_9TREM|nr:unnamed protein product [Schistosoma margrebowiei]
MLMISGQRTLNILCRLLFINTCTFLRMVVVVLQISAPYNRTVFIFILTILTMILVDSWFVLSHSSLLLMVFVQWMLNILCRQLFINTCTILMMVVVLVLEVSVPYGRTVLMLVLQIVTLILVDRQLF